MFFIHQLVTDFLWYPFISIGHHLFLLIPVGFDWCPLVSIGYPWVPVEAPPPPRHVSLLDRCPPRLQRAHAFARGGQARPRPGGAAAARKKFRTLAREPARSTRGAHCSEEKSMSPCRIFPKGNAGELWHLLETLEIQVNLAFDVLVYSHAGCFKMDLH